MYIHGNFKDINNKNIEVQIISHNDTSIEKVIGENGLFFGNNPITISNDIEDSFTHVIKQSLTINFVTKNYVGDLFFSNGARDIKVRVLKENVCIFNGYVTPNTYTQPFIGLDEFSINCTDILSTLQYYNYNNTTVQTYYQNKSGADIATFDTIIKGILNFNFPIYYDLSKGLEANRVANVFDDIAISEIMMYGEDADSLKTQDEVLNGILQYLNLHIIQDGESFYLFDWESLKNGNTQWINLIDGTTLTKQVNNVSLGSDFADSNTNITIAEVYNQISLSCDLEKQDTLIESPLDKDNITSLYSGKQLYMTEYISEGSGDDANNAFNAMVQGNPTSYESAKTVNWYLQVMTNPNWKLNIGNNETIDDICEKDLSGNYINQWKIPKYLRENALNSALLRVGNIEKDGGDLSDNSPVSKIDMSDYLCISINGNETSDENTHLPSDTQLRDKAPLIEYVGNNSGGIYSPSDNDTTNYLVFSGRLLLQPLQYESGTGYATRTNNFEQIRLNGARKTEGTNAQFPNYSEANISLSPLFRSNLVKSDNNSEGRYYTRKFYTQSKVSDNPNTYLISGDSLQTWTKDKSAHGYEYNYSAEGNGTDKYSKLPILECELIIGDKRLIETNIDMYGNSTFQWVTVGNEPTEMIDGVSYPVTTFSLGVNPKIGDYIIGDEYELQNTISYQMNLDATGTAIPIKKSDSLSGKVTFRILGAINTLWNDISRRHPSFWRHTQWSENARFILAHVENIWIKEFECKIYSDNALNENSGSDELVYMSAESNSYVTKKDDIDFMFTTQLTSKECLEKGINTSVNINSPIDTRNNLAVTSIYNAITNETDKPEKHYINEYYNEFSQPKLIIETTLHDNNVSFTNTYNWAQFANKDFYVFSINRDIRFNKATLKLKEI